MTRAICSSLAAEHKGTVVVQRVSAGIGTHATLLLVDVDVDETALAVVQHALEEVGQHGVVAAVAAVQTIGAHSVLGIEAADVLGDDAGDGFLALKLQLGHRTRLHIAPVLVDNLDGLVGVEIARQADADVVGHIVGGHEVADVAHRGVLQVLLAAQGGLVAVGVMGEEGGKHGVVHLAVVLGEAHVLLLVDGLQLGVEQAQHQVLEAVGLNLAPSLQLVVGDVLDIHGVVVAGEGVGAGRADGGHGLVVLVGDGNLRGLVAQAVNLVIDGGASGGVVEHAVGLKQVFNLLDEHLLLLPVGGAEALGTLEHHVLQVVGEAGGLVRVVARAGTNGDVGLNLRSIFVNAHEHLQTIVQRILTHIQRVVGIGLVLVGLLGQEGATAEHRQRHKTNNKTNLFHLISCLLINCFNYIKSN